MKEFLNAVSIEKCFNTVSNIAGLIGGAFVYLFGGWDVLIIALLLLMVFDYISGILKGLYNKEISSKIGWHGIIKKVLTLIVVCLSVVCEKIGIPAIREITIMFFIVNEGISILENASQTGLKIPPKIKEMLLQLREKDGE